MTLSQQARLQAASMRSLREPSAGSQMLSTPAYDDAVYLLITAADRLDALAKLRPDLELELICGCDACDDVKRRVLAMLP